MSIARLIVAGWASALLVATIAGCGPGGVTTFPAEGKIVVENGDVARLAGQTIEFRSRTNANIRAYGQIRRDGTFTMTTSYDGVGKPGVVEGEHDVRVLLDLGDDEEQEDDAGGAPRRRRWPVDPRYTDFETSGWSWTAPSEKELVLTATR